MSKKTILVRGTTYGLSGVHKLKSKAQAQARRFRHRGFNAMVRRSTCDKKVVWLMYSTDR